MSEESLFQKTSIRHEIPMLVDLASSLRREV